MVGVVLAQPGTKGYEALEAANTAENVKAVETRIGPKLGFGWTPGELLTISKPKSENPPARKCVSKPNL